MHKRCGTLRGKVHERVSASGKAVSVTSQSHAQSLILISVCVLPHTWPVCLLLHDCIMLGIYGRLGSVDHERSIIIIYTVFVKRKKLSLNDF